MSITLTPFDLLDTNEALLKLAAAINAGGGGNTISLIADTDIAAGTSVSINNAGHAVQTWGPAPQIAGTAQPFSGVPVTASSTPTLILGPNNWVTFDVASGDAGYGAQAASQSGAPDYIVSCGAINTSVPSQNVITGDNHAGQTNTGDKAGKVRASALSTSAFIAPYNDPTSGNITLAVGSVDGSNNISYGTPVQVQASPASLPWNIVAFSATSFLLVYQDNTNILWAIAGSVSGPTIALGSAVQITPNGANPAISKVTGTTSALVAFQDQNNSSNLSVVAVTLTGTAVALGAINAIVDNNPPYGLAVLSATRAILISGGGSFYGLSITGTTLANGAAYPPPKPASTWSISAVNSDSVIAWDTMLTAQIVTLGAGLALTFTLINQFPPGDFASLGESQYPNQIFGTVATGLLGNNSLMLSDSNFAIYEASSAGVLSDQLQHQFLTQYWLYTLDANHTLAVFTDINMVLHARVIVANPINNGPIAFASSDVSEGDEGTFTTSGVATGFNGLTPGLTYFSSGDGTVIPVNTGGIGTLAGVALTDSTILLQRGRP